MHPDVRVFEPLWTAITGNKALYPVLWELYPDHPLLLYTKWEVDDRLKKTGYAVKPSNGHGGENVQLFNKTDEEIQTT